MVPADSDDITKEYEILLGELKKYNPELLDKNRILAISKSDMLDEYRPRKQIYKPPIMP